MSINFLIPVDGIPATTYGSFAPAGTVQQWLFLDSLEGYRQHGGHPVYGEHDVSYRFNRLGYRCAEFDDTAEIRLLAIGCSYVLGLGVAQDHLFHERFAARLRADLGRSVVVWNLGVAGASNECITRLLHLAIPRLDPLLVLINFTHNGRREYVSVQNRYMNFMPTWRPLDVIT